MDFYLKSINKYVKLDDEIVQKYQKYKDIQENTFIIASYFTHPEGLNSLSDVELSYFCNKALVEDLEMACNVAVAAQFVQTAKDRLVKEGWEDEAVEFNI